jgi:ribosomal-protein-alanine N-acetyltransferase
MTWLTLSTRFGMPANTFEFGSGSPPEIQALPLSLRPFAEEQLTSIYVNWLNDPSVVRFSENRHRSHSLESCRKYFEQFSNGPSSLWAIFDPQNNHIGNISASIDIFNAVADIGILLGAESARGRGYGTLAWGAVLAYLSARNDIQKITAGCMSTNTAMRRIIENSGFEQDGIRRLQYIWEGSRVDVHYYAIHKVTPKK